MPARLPSDVSIQILLSPEVIGADVGPFLLVFGLPPDVVAATLGDVGIEEVVSLATGVSPIRSMSACLLLLLNVLFFQIPDNMAIGVDRCLKQCNLQRGNQTTTQLQPRVAGNAFPQ